ncbi:Kef-type potassium/proton antiporter (CPA2 family) [Paucimonas lemoignei]|uniref:Kef-type potassium/proton antiporter (CPA2 family) n=1 Tax=Paucimonas lemoignei TaxID=29443 RepID=A0A4R3HVW8_PAULE|nr:monovalent cation:proton antiporter family protein [Paucimonas lemoignei]TCS37272.1 Kef-type potassium/proton antiporter (CPA2 family) [Paucimonas lemoignei]
MSSALELTLLLLASAVLAVVVFRSLNLPPMLGYLLVGVLLGPHGFSMAKDNPATHTLGEFGVVFLMFSIGLEFSLPKLMSMRRIVLGLGLAQVALTAVVVMGCGWLVAWLLPQLTTISWEAAFAMGGALAMSSTAIVSKLLTERLELESPHGRNIMGVLLFQDLAFVPLLILIPALARPGQGLMATLSWALVKAVLVLLVLLVVGQKLMRGWFRIVVKRRSQELFMLNLLLMTVGAAWITELAGLSLALGAFVVGMLISETEFKYHVEEDIKPFRDVLLGLFFITIGMLLDIRVVIGYWWLVLLFVCLIILLKFGLVAAIARLSGMPAGVALRTGLGLAQAGEFGFVLLNQAGALNLLDPLLVQIVLAAMVLSMVAAPFILAKSNAIVMRLSSNEWMLQSLALTQIASRTMQSQQHVVIAGFGRTGQSLAKLLEAEGIAYHALDLDLDRVRDAQAGGANVSYGDAARRESLVAAGIHRAAALVITYAGTASALKILHFANELAPNLPVIVRSYDDTDLDRLRAAGATEVVPEAIESSLMLASHALLQVGVPLRKVVRRVQLTREQRYESLRGFYYGSTDASEDSENTQLRLDSVTLGESAYAVNRTLQSLHLDALGAEVTAVRRGQVRLDIDDATILQAGDIVILRGLSVSLALAEERLLKA